MWTSHGSGANGCEYTWLAILGPEIKKTGLEKGEYYVNQIAPTIAKLTGVTIENKKAGNPIIIK